MGLSQRLATQAATRTAVLVAEVPGWGRTRCAVEQEIRRRGWRLATSPADADALVVCGQPGPRLNGAFQLVWSQLPGPRARTVVVSARAVRSALDQLHAGLVDIGHQRQDADARPAEPSQMSPATGMEEDTDDTGSVREGPSGDKTADGSSRDGSESSGDEASPGDSGHESIRHEDPPEEPPGHADAGDQSSQAAGEPSDGERADMGDDMGDMDHDMGDMGDMDMPMPGGIPLAGEGEDRDGLNLDVLHVPLGPVLPAWPAGVLVHCVLQGDVVTDAAVEVLAPADPAPADDDLVHGSPADLLDRTARVLTVAGWDDAAAAATRLRDDLLDADAPGDLLPHVDRLARRVRRSRLLRWSLRTRGSAGRRTGDPSDHSASSEDVYRRLLQLLADVRLTLDGGSSPLRPTPVDRLPELLIGQQLAAVRLLMAAVDLDTTALVRAGAAHA